VAFSPLDLLFPRRCFGCGKAGVYFCPSCTAKIKVLEKQICPVCGRPAVLGRTHPSCRNSLNLDGLISIFVYEKPVREAIKALKYRFVSDLAQSLVGIASVYFKIPVEEGIVVPIPLSSQRKRWRGFNQAEVLGKTFARKNNLGFNHKVVERVVNNQPQVGLSGKERKKNVKGIFRVVDRRLIKKKTLIIFDDVWTTGATLKSCGEVLKREGADEVWGLTLAR